MRFISSKVWHWIMPENLISGCAIAMFAITEDSKNRFDLDSTIWQTFGHTYDTPVTQMDDWILTGAILCVIFLLTPFNIEKYLANLCLQLISSWMSANLLTLNSSKTEFLIIGIKQQLSKIDNSSLNTTHSARNLGFIFDEHPNYFYHYLLLSINRKSHIVDLL